MLLNVRHSSFNVLPLIHSMGVAIFEPIWAREKHPSAHIELIYVIKGHVDVHLKGIILKAGPGDTVLIPRDTIHLDKFDLAEGLETYIVRFRWRAEAGYFQDVSIRRFYKYCMLHHAEIRPWIGRLRAAHSRNTLTDILLARVYLLALLLSVHRGVIGSRPETTREMDFGRRRRKKIFEEARAWIESHYREPVTLDAIARALKISPYYLSHIFSQENNFPLFSYLSDLRMQKAMLLLRQGAYNVSEAAYAVGFNDPNYFSRTFRRYFGLTPRNVRLQG